MKKILCSSGLYINGYSWITGNSLCDGVKNGEKDMGSLDKFLEENLCYQTLLLLLIIHK